MNTSETLDLSPDEWRGGGCKMGNFLEIVTILGSSWP